MAHEEVLKSILVFVIDALKKQDFLVYFRKMSIVSMNESAIVFGVVSPFMRDNLMMKFYDVLLACSQKVIPTLQRIDFEIDPQLEGSTSSHVIDCHQLYKEFQKKVKKGISFDVIAKESPSFQEMQGESESLYFKNTISDRYTLENFVVGPSNQLAYSACEAVVRNPGMSYNPLYIYGEVGLGKTHLLQATGNAILKKDKGKKVRYMTTDLFITEYVTAVKKKSVEKLRQKYAQADVLILDDVQFLAKKEQTQNELYNIFNLFYDSRRQIVLSGDRPPKELKELEERLKSRFEWGIIVDISKPDFETRLAILQEKARAKQFLLPHDVAELIATYVVDSVRELEGVLNQVIAQYELDRSIPTVKQVTSILQKLSFPVDGEKEVHSKSRIRSYKEIISVVSQHFGVEPEAVLGENRKKEFVLPRQVAMYLLKTHLHYSYERIGSIFSGRNHASVLYSCQKLESIIKKDKKLLYEINTLKETLGL